MTTPSAAALINLLGYLTGSALYAMLLAMVFRQSRTAWADEATTGPDWPDRLPLLTGLLGLAWNFGALTAGILQGIAVGRVWLAWSLLPLLNAVAFTALGFLPAVVVHSLLRQKEGLRARPAALWMTILAYGLSSAAGALHFHQAASYRYAPSHWALRALTVGFLGLTVALLFYSHRRPQPIGPIAPIQWTGAGGALALAVFAVSALHLSHHEGREYSWWGELIGHHSSLPLALAILYQDYRFALADIFLKRALSLVLLVALIFGQYLLIAGPLLARSGAPGDHDAPAVGLLLGLWVATALAYPWLRRLGDRFVDAIVLRRADYETVRAEIAQGLSTQDSSESALDEVCLRLSDALTARDVLWTPVESEEANGDDKTGGPLLPQLQLLRKRRGAKRHEEPLRVAAVADFSDWAPANDHGIGWLHARRAMATVQVPVSDPPQYRLLIGELAGGRRLLSDDLALIEAAAVMTARRIDAVRILHERCVRDLHEEEMHKLATEAELRALRAQINPHFLFNALTTIGYLIQSAPDRALETLMRLTALLRGVLRHSDGEFSTLGEEIELIEAYLEIERARFEDRLRVMIDVPDALRGVRIPALLIQPLVENAIKHGVSPQRAGGEVVILARTSRDAGRTPAHAGDAESLQIWVRDTGAGASESALMHGRRRGVGLANVEQRIRRHFGDAGRFDIRSAPGLGTTVELGLPINATRAATMAAR
ncbi:MAG: histidine kinase [Blastocatellia bacterium]|nr:histidine kinase [Blastocatellia bacterium]